MKVLNFLKECWKKRKKTQKIGLTFAFVSILLQILFVVVVPCGVENIKYSTSYIIALCIMAFYISFVVYLAVVAVCHHFITKIKQKRDIVIFLISLVVVTVCGIGICSQNDSNRLNFAKKIDYDTLYGIAEEIAYDDIKEEAEYAREIDFVKALKRKAYNFSWNKKTGCHYATFKSGRGELDVVYDENYQIIETEWIDHTGASVFLILFFISLILLLAVLVSHLVHIFFETKQKV